jgi:two-component system, NarL family, sensor histidine kinase DesK
MDTLMISRPVQNFWDKPWIYFTWLGFLLIPASHFGSREWLATSAATALFVPLYLWSFNLGGVRLWLSRVTMFALGVALFPFNYFSNVFFIYAGVPGAGASVRESLVIMLLSVAGSFVYFYLHHLDPGYFGIDALLVLGIGGGMLYAEVTEKARATIAVKDQEILRLAKFAERERIARDLHDLLGHTLSLIALKAELACKLMPQDGERAVAEMREVGTVARKSLADVRQAIAGLHSIGLLDAIKTADILLRVAGLRTRLQLCPLPALSAAQEQALSQAVIEAATNIVRHASASRASIDVTFLESTLTMIVEDDGRGGSILPGNGLGGMRQRLESVNAALVISSLEPGLRVTAQIRVDAAG